MGEASLWPINDIVGSNTCTQSSEVCEARRKSGVDPCLPLSGQMNLT